MTSYTPRPGQPALERFIKDEIARRFRSERRFFKATEYPSASFYRVVGDSPEATDRQARHLEGALGLPRYVLDYILDVNVPALESAGLEPDQLRAILHLLDQDRDEGESERRQAAG